MTTGIVIVEDDARMCRRLREALSNHAEISLLGIARGVVEGKAMLSRKAPDVALIDLGLPDGSGIDLVRFCHSNLPECEVLVISVFADEANVMASIDAGAHGYLLKDVTDEEIVNDILALRDGGSPISPVIARQLLLRFQHAEHAEPATPPDAARNHSSAKELLTAREVAVLTLLSRGYSYAEIATRLFISINTVASHIKQIYRKLSVNSRGAAVFKATREGQLASPRDLS